MKETVQELKEFIRQGAGMCRCDSMEEVKQRLENGSCWIWHTHTLPKAPDTAILTLSEKSGTCQCEQTTTLATNTDLECEVLS